MTAPTLCGCGCGKAATPNRLGWNDACYFRWYRAGKPTDGPPAPRRGRDWAAALREECAWLAEGGTGHAEIAERLDITVATVKRYLSEPSAPPVCVVDGCIADATSHGRWCDEHADTCAVYRAFRAAGHNRVTAARLTGVQRATTYQWEPGQPGAGRPRKKAA